MLYAVMSGLTTPFWGAFAVRLGAGDYMLALLSSLPALVQLLAQIPSAVIVDHYETRLRPTLQWAFLERIFFLLFAVLPFLPIPLDYKPMVFVLLYSIRTFPSTTCNIAWTSMMGEMFSPRLRGRLFGERNMLCTLATLLSTVAAGPLLDRIMWPWNYFSLYTLSFGAVMGSLLVLTKHKELPAQREERSTATSGLKAFALAMHDKPFVRFLIAVMAIHLGFHVSTSLWTILWVKIMGLSNAWIGLFSTASGVASFLSYRSWGYWSEKHGNAKVLALTGLAHVIVPVVYAHSRSPYIFLGLNVFGGFIGAGLNLALFNMLLDVSPSAGRPAYVASYNMGLGISGFLWPFLGVFLYDRLGITVALDWCAVLRVVGMVAAAFILLRSRSAEMAAEAAKS